MHKASVDNRTRVLNAARELLQTRGINAFSHRDLAERVGIKSSSVHYYFPTKEDLGVALIRSYQHELTEFFEATATLPTVIERLTRFCGLFEGTAKAGGRLCLAGMLASDFATLGPSLQSEVRAFFQLVEAWLAAQAALSKPERSPAANADLSQLAFSLLEGVLLSARVFDDPDRTRRAARHIQQLFGSPSVQTNTVGIEVAHVFLLGHLSMDRFIWS